MRLLHFNRSYRSSGFGFRAAPILRWMVQRRHRDSLFKQPEVLRSVILNNGKAKN
jgi:hypothetical protein